MQQSTNGPLDRIDVFSEVPQSAVLDDALLARVRAGAISLREYTLFTWALRCWHLPIEQLAWDSRSDTVKGVRPLLKRKVSLLERDLVSLCGKELVVPAELNRTLDAFAQLTSRGTTPARMLGRLYVCENLFASLAGSAARVETSLDLDSGATHYLRGCSYPQAHLEDVRQCFASALVGEVPMQNAVEGSREASAQLQELLSLLVRLTTRQAAAS
ncbi:MAG: hypothetical protein OXU20_36800 [Myxococcales bacterium]|nr:hypothetical protein [Myxococcales bacterium]MDD9966072.1 hypothetical protein [Myxococcales bacterium]